MDEELIDYLFETSRREGFKKNREDFVKYLQSDDELFDYLYGKAQKEGYKKDKAHFAGLVGRTTTAAPVAKTEPAKTEVVAATTEHTKTEPTKTEPAKIEIATTTTPAKTEPAKTEPAKPTVTVATETAPAKTEVVAETKVEPSITVKEVEAPVKEEPKKELPVSTGLTPITEKTEVKAVETPSDKMVIKSEKKEEPVKAEPAIEVKEVTKEEPKMVIKSDKKEEQPVTVEEDIDLSNEQKEKIIEAIKEEINNTFLPDKKQESNSKLKVKKGKKENKNIETIDIQPITAKKVDIKEKEIDKANEPDFPVEPYNKSENKNIVPYKYKEGTEAEKAWEVIKKVFPEAVNRSYDWYKSWYEGRSTLPEFKKIASDRLKAIEDRLIPVILEAHPDYLSKDRPGQLATSYREKVINPENKPYENKIYISSAVDEDMEYNKEYNREFINPEESKTHLKNEAIHEYSHWLENNYPQLGTDRDVIDHPYNKNFGDKILQEILPKNYLAPNEKSDQYDFNSFNGLPSGPHRYISAPTEIRARLERWREFNDISPTKKYSEEEIKEIIENNIEYIKNDESGVNHMNIIELFKLIHKNPKVLKELNEKLVSVDRKESKKTESFNPNPFEIKTG